MHLPSGFVTMLMTDVEGSTALVHRLGDRYRELINELRAFLTEAIVARNGLVVETRADELFAVFEAAAQALDAAVTIQRHLRSRTWDDGVEVRVRAGLHSGYPTQTDANYIGLPVHAAARISAAAHGGQILTSGDTRAGVRFRTLGSFRLRGLPDAIPLYQVAAAGLASQFPPLRGAKQ